MRGNDKAALVLENLSNIILSAVKGNHKGLPLQSNVILASAIVFQINNFTPGQPQGIAPT
jgi:hypothetical protein